MIRPPGVDAADPMATASSHQSQRSTIPYEDCRSVDSQATIRYDDNGNPSSVQQPNVSSGTPQAATTDDPESDSDASTIPESGAFGPELFSNDSTRLYNELIYYSTYHSRSLKDDAVVEASRFPEFELQPVYAAMLETPISLDGDEV